MQADSEAAYKQAVRDWERTDGQLGVPPIPESIVADMERLSIARVLDVPVTVVTRLPLRWIGLARLEIELEHQRSDQRRQKRQGR